MSAAFSAARPPTRSCWVRSSLNPVSDVARPSALSARTSLGAQSVEWSALLGEQLAEGSIYRLLAEHGDVLFVDGYFADLFTGSPWVRPTVPTRVVATVMLLQAHEGLSDREACGNEVERAEVGDELSLEGPLVVEVEVLERLVRGEARGADSFRSPGVRL